MTQVALMPGVVTSNLLRGLGLSRGFDSAETAATGPAWLATEATLDPSAEERYYHGKAAQKCKWAADRWKAVGEALWDECARVAAPYVGSGKAEL